MAGDWIKLEIATLDKPEVYEIAEAVDISADEALGKLVRFWAWCDQQSPESGDIGHRHAVTLLAIDRVTMSPGFGKAMESVGWLEEVDGKTKIPNFGRHNGKPAKTRARNSKNKSLSRSSEDKTATCVTESRGQNGDQRREEKRRIDSILPTPHQRPTLEQSKAAGPQLGVTPEEAESWWHAREANDWLKATAGGAAIPVGASWQSDMKRFTEIGRERKHGKKHKGSSRGGNGGHRNGAASDGGRATAKGRPADL